MWLRFLAISFLKWMALNFLSILFFEYIAPSSWHGFVLAIPIWILSFAVAFGFAEWAFKTKFPERKTIATLLVIWMIVSYTLHILQAQFLMGSALFVINSIDIYVQYLLEILAILLAARTTKKRKILSLLGEGMEA